MSKHAEFPKMLYKKGSEPIVVSSQKEQDEHDGWNVHPPEHPEHGKGDEVVHPNDGKEVIPSSTTTAKLVNDAQTKQVAESKPPVLANATKNHGADEKRGANAVHGLK